MTQTSDLVRLLDLDDDFIIELRYATDDNFTGKKIYTSGECYINRHTAQLLIKARDLFRRDGYRVKIWDAYRPLSAQKKLWEVVPDDRFVARPPDMSKVTEFRPSHLNGLCVDLTLTDLNGVEIEMPTAFDAFGPKAGLDRNDPSSSGFRNGSYLRRIMESVGFAHYSNEWWHFNDTKTTPPPYLDLPI